MTLINQDLYPNTIPTETVSDPPEESIQDILETFIAILDGSVDPLDAGFVHPKPKLLDGLHANIYTQERVASWGSDGSIVLGDVAKFKTMADPMSKGSIVEQLLRDSGKLTTKEISRWRVARSLARKISIDEAPQFLFNVARLKPAPSDDLMKMKLVAAARPPLQHEIALTGDNSNDYYGRALAKVADKAGRKPREMHERLGHIYVPGFFTPATALGNRQLDGEEGYTDWIQGILDYEAIRELPNAQRLRAHGRIILGTFKHVLARTDAE